MTSKPGVIRQEPAGRARWQQVLQNLEAESLDCLQTSLALLCDHFFDTGSHLGLGRRWRLPLLSDDGTVGVQPTLRERLDEAAESPGLPITAPRGVVDAERLQRLVADAGLVYVVADAYRLPWLPYAGRRHLPHSFLLEAGAGGYTVVDAYHNDTPWGDVRPGTWLLPVDKLKQAVPEATVVLLDDARGRPSAQPPAALAVPDEATWAVDAYVLASQANFDHGRLDGLVLDTWLLARSRALYAKWQGDAAAQSGAARSAQAWQLLAMKAFLAQRRHARDGRLSDGLIGEVRDQLRCDLGHVAGPGKPASAVAYDAVVDSICEVLHVSPTLVQACTALRSLPRFTSRRLLDILDRTERTLGMAWTDEPRAEDLRDVGGLARMFGASRVGHGHQASR